MVAFYLALLSFLILSTLPYIRAQRISTTNGDIVGTRSTISGTSVDTYYGIPFAKPPVGDLRFKHPVAADSWRPVLKNTTERKAACYQASSTNLGMPWRQESSLISEDCLFINAWVPTTTTDHQTLSTMIWIYGGSFRSGSINRELFDGRYLAAEQNVIVMSMNYRLGAHGFLYLSPDTFPGNQGMMDQVLAMKWIYENVERFGGDRNSITLFGESAGAACVGHHLLSPHSKDFFNRAILESGVAIAEWATVPLDVAESAARELAKDVGCPISSTSEIHKCLQKIDPATIVEKQMTVKSSATLPFAPIVDGYFLPDVPINLLRKGQMNQVDILLGTNKDEGTLFLVGMFPTVFLPLPTISVTKQQFDQTVIQGLVNGRAAPAINAIYAQYIDTKLVADRDYIDISGNIFGDNHFVCPAISLADILANQTSIFLYSFEHRLSVLRFPPWMGVTHSFELEFVFGLLLGNTITGTPEEVQLSRQIMSYWAQFAKTGNPNLNGQSGLTWPKYDLDKEKYLVLDLPGKIAVRQGHKKQECVFWNSIEPIILETKKKSDTQPHNHECTISGSRARNPAIITTVLLAILSRLWSWT